MEKYSIVLGERFSTGCKYHDLQKKKKMDKMDFQN